MQFVIAHLRRAVELEALIPRIRSEEDRIRPGQHRNPESPDSGRPLPTSLTHSNFLGVSLHVHRKGGDRIEPRRRNFARFDGARMHSIRRGYGRDT